MQIVLALGLVALVGLSVAQDPADGWMAYAQGSIPSGAQRVTSLSMVWKVGAKPHRSSAFFSPWFGMDPSDNLNLIQPVNPFEGGLFSSGWSMYTEYFQWRPVHNSNSPSRSVESGQHLHGKLEYMAESDSYTLSQTIVETGVTSTQVVKCQSGKKYTVPYIVYEKTFPCKDYPPDGVVTFTNITSECDGKPCEIQWTPKVKDANCNMKAVVNGKDSVSITWDTSAPSKYDSWSRAALHDKNYNGWATKLNITRPADEESTTPHKKCDCLWDTCRHHTDAADNKCYQACAIGIFSDFKMKGLERLDGCPDSYTQVTKKNEIQQCSDGKTNIKYCKGGDLKIMDITLETLAKP